MIDFEKDSGPVAATEDSLQRIISLAELLKAQADQVASIEEQLRQAKEAYQRTERTDLPDLMKELGVPELKLPDGSKVTATEDFTTSIAEANMQRAIAWLAERDHDGIVKTFLSIAFDRGERDEADLLLSVLQDDIQQPITKKEGIHPQTLKAYVKEQREAGEDVPEDIFGIYVFNKAKLTAPPKPKKLKKAVK